MHMFCWLQNYLLAHSTMALTQAVNYCILKLLNYCILKNTQLKSLPTLVVSLYAVTCCWKRSLEDQDAYIFPLCVSCILHDTTLWKRPPVASCSQRVKFKPLQNQRHGCQPYSAFLGSSRCFLSTEEKYLLAKKILPCLEWEIQKSVLDLSII